MKVAYIFKSNMASTFQLATMILPQLEQGKHGAEVAGMMFFDDNLFCLAQGNDVGMRLAKVAKEKNILLMICDQCAIRRGLGEGSFEQCGSGEVIAKIRSMVWLRVVVPSSMRHLPLTRRIK